MKGKDIVKYIDGKFFMLYWDSEKEIRCFSGPKFKYEMEAEVVAIFEEDGLIIVEVEEPKK